MRRKWGRRWGGLEETAGATAYGNNFLSVMLSWTRRHSNTSVVCLPSMSAVCDFDLSQALDGPAEEDEQRSESGIVTMTQGKGDVQEAEEKTYQLDSGLDLVVSRSRTGLQGVANLLLATSRMRKPSKLCSNAQLCDSIFDHVVQETVLESHVGATAAAPRVYYRAQSGDFCHLLDHSQKAVVKASAGMTLQAITLKGGDEEHRVRFNMAKYVHTCGSNDDGLTVALSISNSSLHISCSMKCGTPVLSLEECSKEDLQTIGADGNMKRFLFNKRTYGKSLTKFESVKYRGWFISTSSDNENEPVEMCEAHTVKRCFNFNMP